MANSKFEYVKSFEQVATLMPNTYIVVRIDGRAFHRLSSKYGFEKPNDRRALNLMNAAASAVLKELSDITCAFGMSDEYSFVFDLATRLFDRRESKILTAVVSTFTSHYAYLWHRYFPDTPLTQPMPSFDGRVVLYPSVQNLRDYLSWRQVDCHINNLYNTTFWALVQRGGMSTTEAEQKLKGTSAADKNELLFSNFQINYNREPEISKKGSVLYRDRSSSEAAIGVQIRDLDGESDNPRKESKRRSKAIIATEHTDIIKDDFWNSRGWLID